MSLSLGVLINLLGTFAHRRNIAPHLVEGTRILPAMAAHLSWLTSIAQRSSEDPVAFCDYGI
jgi:hypothetical protein